MVTQRESQVFVRAYRGSQAEAYGEFQTDAPTMAAAGWFPTTQQWIPGSSGAAAAILAYVTMVWMKRPGTLYVTYQAHGPAVVPPESFEDWVYRVGVVEARGALERDMSNEAITRGEYADGVAAIDHLQLD
jgi:hypothetical protein